MLRYQIAKGKASGALGLGVSSPKIGEMALERPSFVASVGTVAPHWVISVAGGIIVTGRDGQLLRAVGVTGETSDNDDVCALAGIAAALLTPQR
jgi:uncharacterized protein GlcG (DUF336 family)